MVEFAFALVVALVCMRSELWRTQQPLQLAELREQRAFTAAWARAELTRSGHWKRLE